MKKSMNLQKEVFIATRKDDAPRLYRALQENGGFTDIRDENNLTPLMWAARKNSVNCAILLLDNGANIDALDSVNGNALFHGAWYNSVAVGKVLIERNINLSQRDMWNQSPLPCARGSSAIEYYVLVRRAMISKGLIVDENPVVFTFDDFRQALENEPKIPEEKIQKDAR